MGWAATTTMLSGPEVPVHRCWSAIQEAHDECEFSFEWGPGLAESLRKEDGVQEMQKTGPHCGYSDPLLEELAAIPHVGTKLGLVANGDMPEIRDPADERIVLLSHDGDESIRHWWMARASDLLEPIGTTAVAQARAAMRRICEGCGESVHLTGAQFCCRCGNALPDAGADDGRRELMNRLKRELAQARQAVTPSPSAFSVDGTQGMRFEHAGPHQRRTEKYASPVRYAVETALRTLEKPVSQQQTTELRDAVRTARTSLMSWDRRDDEIEERRRNRDLGGSYGDRDVSDDPEDPDDDDDGYGYTYGGRICFQFRDRGYCSYGAACRFRHPNYTSGCSRTCHSCSFATRQALKLCSEHLYQVEEALQLKSNAFATDAEMIASAARNEQLCGVSGFLARAAALDHWVLINHDNDGC